MGQDNSSSRQGALGETLSSSLARSPARGRASPRGVSNVFQDSGTLGGQREMTNSRSILPLQPTGLPSRSGMVPRSSNGCVVSPTPDSPEVDPVDVELLPAPEPVLSIAVVSPVDPAGTVVISGVLENPDEPEAGAWQAPSMASSVSLGRRGLIGTQFSAPGVGMATPVTFALAGPTGDRLRATTRGFCGDAPSAVYLDCGSSQVSPARKVNLGNLTVRVEVVADQLPVGLCPPLPTPPEPGRWPIHAPQRGRHLPATSRRPTRVSELL